MGSLSSEIDSESDDAPYLPTNMSFGPQNAIFAQCMCPALDGERIRTHHGFFVGPLGLD